jgi:uncharacterized protein (DUF58 family)
MKSGAIAPQEKDKSSDKMQIHIRLRLPLVLLGMLLITAVYLPDRVWNTLLIGFGGLFVVSFIWTYSLSKNLHVNRSLRFGWVAIGDRLSEQFELENTSFIPALWVEIEDHSTLPGYSAAVVQSVAGYNKVAWRRSAICLRRGLFTIGPWSVRCGDPFGIFVATRHFPHSSEILIHPPIHGKLPIPLPPGKTGGRARARQRSLQATINASSVREYHPGDPYRWVHWPMSAHRDKLFVREFDVDAAGDFWLVLDLEESVQVGDGPDGTEEHAVLLGASLCAQAIRHMRETGLATYSANPQVIHPGVGEGHIWQILRVLALVNADGDVPLATSLRHVATFAKSGSTAVIITPSCNSNWVPSLLDMARRGIQAHIILLDRPSFGGEGNTKGLQDAIHHIGFAADIIHQGEVGEPLEKRKSQGFWEFKVTPMGRVITIHNPNEGVKR